MMRANMWFEFLVDYFDVKICDIWEINMTMRRENLIKHIRSLCVRVIRWGVTSMRVTLRRLRCIFISVTSLLSLCLFQVDVWYPNTGLIQTPTFGCQVPIEWFNLLHNQTILHSIMNIIIWAHGLG